VTHPRGLRGVIERTGINRGIMGWRLFAGWLLRIALWVIYWMRVRE
jgi:hypothetical protein